MGKSRVPEIRFCGFTDDWEQRKFNETFDFLQNNTLTRAELGSDGEVINVHYGDILIKYGEVLDIAKDELTYLIDSSITKKYQTSLLRNGDVIVADAAEDETVGKCSEITGLSGETVLSGLHTIPCRPTIKFAQGYLGYYMNSSAYHDQLLPLIQGTKISSISKSAIQGTDIVYPKSEVEQAQIGTYFRELDNLITLHQQQLDLLKQMKQGFLQKMFPKDGETVPEIRFPGFNDDWEQCKLGSVIDLRSGRDYKHLQEGDIPVYGTGGYMLSVNEALSYQEDAIGIGRKGTIDKPYVLKAPFWTVDTLFYAVPAANNDLAFIFDIFQNINWKQKDESTGVPSLSKTAINEIDVLIPKYEEQKTIGKYFQNIDNLITLHQQELDLLKQSKKAFLQKMFI